MTQTYIPFNSGAGANVTETGWFKMARRWLGTGVLRDFLNQLEVFADASGMQVKVKSGGMWIEGHYFESDAQETIAIAAADPTNPRVDRVVVRLDRTNDVISFAVRGGVAAASPVAINLQQTDTIWEESLAQVRVDAAASSIAANKVTDERSFAGATQLADQAAYQAWALA